MNELTNKRLFLLDMDGTLYLDDRLFPGAADFLAKIRACGGKYLFLTNNSSKGVDAYVAKMTRLGVPAAPADFLTSVDALIVFLERTYGAAVKKKKMYVVGTRSFCAQLAAAGFLLTETPDDDTAILILGFDRELTYRKLEDACRLLARGRQEARTSGDAKAAAGLPAVDYYATNPDWVCPTAFGSVPDCGSMAWMLEKATGRLPKFIGKPEPEMALLAMAQCGCSAAETLLIGDRLYTDIACGNRAGVDTAFVLSGEGTLADLAKGQGKPTYIFENIAEVCKAVFG